MTMAIVPSMGSFMTAWFTVFYGLPPLLQHLRVLRTLPISASRLALVLLATTLLPFVVVGSLAAGVASVPWGLEGGIVFLKSYTTILAPLALCLFLGVWRGIDRITYALQLIVLFGFFLVPIGFHTLLQRPEGSFTFLATLTGVCVWLGFELTHYALLRHTPSSGGGGGHLACQ